MDTANTMQGPWGHPRHRPSPLRLAAPLAVFGAVKLAQRRGRGGPSPLRLVLPLALIGGARMALLSRGRHRGPFGPGGPPHGQGPFDPNDGEGGNPFGGNPFGGRGPFRFPFGGPGGPFGGGPRAKRGDVRAGILALLAEEPRNGYQIIQELGQRSNGAWRPSPGSIYPALQQLEDEGLIRAEEVDGKKAFRLTDEGRAYVEAHRDEVAAPWEAMAGSMRDEARELVGLIQQVSMAAMQVLRTGNPRQAAEARKVLNNSRRSLYRILAEDDAEEGTETGEVGHL